MATSLSRLTGSARPLVESFDVALLDLDGVVYLGDDVVAGVPESLRQCRALGMRLAFVTNNASRTPDQVAQRLRTLGVPAEAGEVVTSAQAAAHYLAQRLPAAAAVLVVGAEGLREALRERGLVPVCSAEEQPLAVVQGYGPQVDAAMLSEAAVALGRGVPWVATNLDATLPSPRGQLPGNGAFVAALRHATGCTPIATGKPDPTMHAESVERSAARHPIVVGDRLDTDIAGADAVGCPSLLVLSGVTDARRLLSAAPTERPTYLGYDLSGLLLPHPDVELDGQHAHCGNWTVEVNAGGVCLRSRGGTDLTDGGIGAHGNDSSATDDLDALRALCTAVWSWRDAAGEAAVMSFNHVGRAAAQALSRLGL